MNTRMQFFMKDTTFVLNKAMFIGVFAVAVISCSSKAPEIIHGASDPTNNFVKEKANPCATPGSTYSMHWVEQSGGTCGPMNDTTVVINSDGTVDDPNDLECSSSVLNGCHIENNDCTSFVTGEYSEEVTISTDVTFSEDGSSAEGIVTMTLEATDGSFSCKSSYSVLYFRE